MDKNCLDIGGPGGFDQLAGVGWSVYENARVGLWAHEYVSVIVIRAALQLVYRDVTVLVMRGHYPLLVLYSWVGIRRRGCEMNFDLGVIIAVDGVTSNTRPRSAGCYNVAVRGQQLAVSGRR